MTIEGDDFPLPAGWIDCGSPYKMAPGVGCLTCGCAGDSHPGASAGSGCTCDNFHPPGGQSRKEYEEEKRRAKGHYIRQAPPPSEHYCEKPSVYYAWSGEIWQCDICHQKWKFKRSLFERIAVVTGDWKPIR